MAAGTLQSVAVCSTTQGTVLAAGRAVTCGTDSNGNTLYVSTVQAYVLSPDSAGYIDSIAQPFDYSMAAGFWGVAFTTVVGLWLVARSAGAVISVVRRGF